MRVVKMLNVVEKVNKNLVIGGYLSLQRGIKWNP